MKPGILEYHDLETDTGREGGVGEGGDTQNILGTQCNDVYH